MITNLNYVLIPIMLAALLALWPAWLLVYRVTFSSRRWWISVLRLLLVPIVAAGLGGLAFLLPFWLSSGRTVGPFVTLIDLLLYGVFPLVAVGLVAYAIDHFSERPMMIIVATASCLSIAGLPIAYFFLAEEYHRKYNIQVEALPAAENPPAAAEPPAAQDNPSVLNNDAGANEGAPENPRGGGDLIPPGNAPPGKAPDTGSGDALFEDEPPAR